MLLNLIVRVELNGMVQDAIQYLVLQELLGMGWSVLLLIVTTVLLELIGMELFVLQSQINVHQVQFGMATSV